MATRLEKLREKQEQLQNRIRQEEAKLRTRERKMETRRKILLGALLQAMMDERPTLKKDVDERLESFLTRAMDREAFGLTGGTISTDSEEDGGELDESNDDGETNVGILASQSKPQERALA